LTGSAKYVRMLENEVDMTDNLKKFIKVFKKIKLTSAKTEIKNPHCSSCGACG
jgi:hypothetical protein